jgi:hypothetical protein
VILRFLAMTIVVAAVTATFSVKLPRGLNVVYQNSPTPDKYLIATMGGGIALCDYNNAGLLDIFL